MGTSKRIQTLIWLVILAAASAAAPPADSQPSEPSASTPAAPDPAPASSAAPAAPPAAPASPQGGDLKSWVQAHPRSAKDAVLGFVTGALGGCLLARARGGNCVRGALVGGSVGAVAGFLIGRNQDRVSANRDDAVRAIDYQPSQGYVLRLQEVTTAPASIAPGGDVTLSVRYLVIGPNPRERITVNSFRGIKYQGNYLNGDGPTQFVVVGGGGIVTSSSTITLPKEAPAGSYSIESIVEGPQGSQGSGAAPLYIVAANG